jgi:hypothetical protein
MEELILADPANDVAITTYAELLYNVGTEDDRETARRYFLRAAEINPHNARAALGALVASIPLVPGKRADGSSAQALEAAQVAFTSAASAAAAPELSTAAIAACKKLASATTLSS